jgi:hypothetical protein
LPIAERALIAALLEKIGLAPEAVLERAQSDANTRISLLAAAP